MDESSSHYANLPSSHLLGSVPAVITEEKHTAPYAVPEANLQIFPPNNGGDKKRGYQTLESPSEGEEQQPTNNWKGYFNVASYTQYFNVDTDDVINRLMSSLQPLDGDFFHKIEANPDLYGLIWISTTLVFVLASLGNCATYLSYKHSDSRSNSWRFDVGYVSLAAWSVYGYALLVPVAFYFLLQYLGSNASLLRFWCMWGYSLFLFILTSFLLVIPVEFLRWLVIIGAGGASACFVALNLRSYVEGYEGNDLTLVILASFILQMGLAIFFKVEFFP